MIVNKLQLNGEKTDFVITGSTSIVKKFYISTINLVIQQQKKQHKKPTKFQKKIESELGLDPPTHFRGFLGFWAFF